MSFIAAPIELGGEALAAGEELAAAAELGGESAAIGAEAGTEIASATGEELSAGEELVSTESRIERAADLVQQGVSGQPGGVSIIEQIQVRVEGAEKARHDIEGMARRVNNLAPVMRQIARNLEVREVGKFAGGKYVRTGATRASLTAPTAPGAVRKVTPTSLRFGTDIPYARFLVENPGPVTPAGGLVRRGHPSAIMAELTPEETEHFTRSAGDYVMLGRGSVI